MGPVREHAVLSAEELSSWNEAVEALTHAALRRSLSDSFKNITHRQGPFVCDAYQRRTREMWRTADYGQP